AYFRIRTTEGWSLDRPAASAGGRLGLHFVRGSPGGPDLSSRPSPRHFRYGNGLRLYARVDGMLGEHREGVRLSAMPGHGRGNVRWQRPSIQESGLRGMPRRSAEILRQGPKRQPPAAHSAYGFASNAGGV